MTDNDVFAALIAAWALTEIVKAWLRYRQATLKIKTEQRKQDSHA